MSTPGEPGAGAGLERERIVRMRTLGATPGEFRVGSGYVVAPGLVVTARHVLVPPGVDSHAVPERGQACEVSLAGETESWRPGLLRWRSENADVALVAAPGVGDGLPPVRWGRLGGGEPLRWAAAGYPSASRDEQGRHLEHAWGMVSPITLSDVGKLGLSVASRVPGFRPGTKTEWSGLSGAAIVCGARVIGVVTEDPVTYNGSINDLRAEHWADDPDLATELGDPLVLEEVRGTPLAPGLADLWHFGLPDVPPAFTGRDGDLDRIAQTAGVVALHGLGGVGKSSVAAAYAHRCVEASTVRIVWWFDAQDRVSLIATLAQQYTQLTGHPSGEDAAWGANRLKNWLETCPYRWLVVLDGADTPGTVDNLIPRTASGQVLITSRHTQWPTAVPLELDVLPSHDALDLLYHTTGQAPDDAAERLVDELGGLALALRQAGVVIRRTRWTYQRYFDELAGRPLALYARNLEDAERTVAQVWDTSLQQVRTTPGGDLAIRVLAVLAYLAPAPIPRAITTTSPGLATVITTDPVPDNLDIEIAVVALADQSLVDVADTTVSLHRTIATITRHQHDATNPANRETDHPAARAVRLLSAATVRDTTNITELLPHVLQATEHAVALGVGIEDAAAVLNTTVEAFLGRGQLDTARGILDQAERAAELLGPDHPDTLTTRNNIAYWTGEAGRPDVAVELFSAVLPDMERVLGPDHPDTLSTRGNIAYWTGEAGRPDAAVELFNALLPDMERVLGPDHPDTLTTRNNIAAWTGRAGRPDAAVELFSALLSDQERVLGPDHSGTLSTRGNIAGWTGRAGRPDVAVELFSALLPDRERVLGPDHSGTLGTRNNIAALTGEGGRPDVAVELFSALLPDMERVLGSDHPDTLGTRGNIAAWTGRAGRPDVAVELFSALLPDRERVLGSDHPDTLGTRNNIADLTGEAGRPDVAVELFSALLPDQERVLGPDHPDTLSTRNNIAAWTGRAGRPDVAVELFSALLRDQERVLGSDHPDTFTNRNNIAYLTGRAGRPDVAVELFSALLPDRERVLGSDHPDTLSTRLNIAYWTGEAGRPDVAVELFSALLPDQERVLGPDHPETLTTRNLQVQMRRLVDSQ
jgi:Tetratricopeptide repeat/Trypsin-like peptidase domain